MASPPNSVPLPPPRPKDLDGASSSNSSRPKPDAGGSGSDATLEEGEERPLTSGEKAILKKYFGSSVNYDTLKVHHGKYIPVQPSDTAMTPQGEAYFPGNLYRDDYSKEGIGGRAFFVHEMTHAWQHQNNVVGDIRALGFKNVFNYRRTGSGRSGRYLYDYSYHPKDDGTRDLLDYGFEQQASIVEDYYRMVNGQHCYSCGGAMTLDDYDNPQYGLLRNFLSNPGYAKGHGEDPGVKE